VNAGTFYKALSYACLYKAEAGAADIFDADTTVSIVRESHVWITSLTRTLSRDDARELLDNCAELGSEEDRRNADSVVNVASEANVELFKKMIQEGDQMCEELKELLAPEIVEFKIRLAEQDAKLADNAAKLADKDAKLADNAAKLADNAAEIAKLKKLLAEAGIKE
jgi:X-X-X-Leu-X-X-Gly heptad repeat protein